MKLFNVGCFSEKLEATTRTPKKGFGARLEGEESTRQGTQIIIMKLVQVEKWINNIAKVIDASHLC